MGNRSLKTLLIFLDQYERNKINFPVQQASSPSRKFPYVTIIPAKVELGETHFVEAWEGRQDPILETRLDIPQLDLNQSSHLDFQLNKIQKP